MRAVSKQVILIVLASIGLAASQDACRTPNHRDGRCISRAECRSFVQYFSSDRILNQDELNFIRLSQCSFDPPGICCPDRASPTPPSPTTAPTVVDTASTTTTATSARPTSFAAGDLLPNPAKFECGLDFLADRIFGGQDTTLEEFPWYALLQYRTKKGEMLFECGGTLISQRYVLTAAHCLDNAKLDGGEQLISIRLGEHDTTTEIDCEGNGTTLFCADPPQDFTFEELVLHPGYSKNDRNQHHDIALIRLEKDAELNDFVTPICLPVEGFSPTLAGRNVSITGFGHTGRKRHSGVKQKALVPIVDQGQCREKWGRIALDDGQLCAGGHFNIDSCNGDSGGPLMTQRLFWTLEGVVSFGNKCGLEGWPGVYTRVASYVDWIKSTIRA